MKRILLPPSKIGIIGGGQLGRMFALEAKRMGYIVYVLDPKENSPAGQVSDEQIVSGFDDFGALLELARKTDVITYEFEHINAEHLTKLKNMGYKIYPSPETLIKIQNKYIQKKHLIKFNLPVPRFERIESYYDLVSKADDFKFPFMIKFAKGGYDGKGNIKIENHEDILNLKNLKFEEEIFMEEFVDFRNEISIIVCKNEQGEFKNYRAFENVHEDNILRITKCPARIGEEVEKKAVSIANKVVESFCDFGVFCVEMFVDKYDEILINEIAPRPHNSGHLTIEACFTSQFENHLRSITNLPLGSTELIKNAIMINILGDKKIDGKYTIENLGEILKMDGVFFHFYGKSFVDKKKKVGHITIIDDDETRLEAKKNYIINNLKIGEFYE
ncbi:5-(carboxyamino)imidazole ribonucleotide synthase [Caloramator mitchellensis]|nr:5-(carboxyamino)imidazole ribonucleotide synthase [Caloramator mitchellensis]